MITMRPPVWKMSKTNIVKLAMWRCEHGETGLSHYNCYLRSEPQEERIGFLDLECSSLTANWGIILSYSIKVKGEDKIYSRLITAADLKTCLDKNVVNSCITDMQRFDRIVTFYGTKFDLPFLRTRALTLGITNFPEFGQKFHKDMYYVARNKLRLHSNRLDVVCQALFGTTTKTRIEPTYWTHALMGDKKALNYILDHNRQDVIELERVYDTLIGFTQINNTSI
jgi:uncharacterized protein YprB with RNaseH-like and TPR domain